jgi:hypothetical protein
MSTDNSASISIDADEVVDPASRMLSRDRIADELQDYAMLEASFGQAVTSEVSSLMEGGSPAGDSAPSKTPVPVLCLCLSCGILLLALSALICGGLLIGFALRHFQEDFMCETRLGVWLLLWGCLVVLWTLTWCGSVFLLSSWFYRGLLHLLSTFSAMWFLVGNLWILSLPQPHTCSDSLVYMTRAVIVTCWAALAILFLPTATLWITR